MVRKEKKVRILIVKMSRQAEKKPGSLALESALLCS